MQSTSKSIIAPLKITQVSLAQAGTGYTESIRATFFAGEMGALVTIGGSGSVKVSQQCSINGVDWYDPVDPDANAVGEIIATAATAGTTFRKFTMVITPYVRFKCVEQNVNTATVDIVIVFQE